MFNRQEFEKLVEEALVGLPPEFARKMENIDIVVEDEPGPERLNRLKLEGNMTLFGLYEGIPQTKRGEGYTFVLPDKITIFQKPIETYCLTPEAIRQQVRKTVLHEIAHHFGISDESLVKTKVG